MDSKSEIEHRDNDQLAKNEVALMRTRSLQPNHNAVALDFLEHFQSKPGFRRAVWSTTGEHPWPSSPLALLPYAILDSIASLLVIDGSLDLFRTCTSLAARLQPLIYRHGIFRFLIGPPPIPGFDGIAPQNLPKPDILARIKRLDIVILLVHTPTALNFDVNFELLRYFRGAPVSSRHCNLTLVGTPGQFWNMSGYLKYEHADFTGFTQLNFNIRCISPYVNITEWKENGYDCLMNDLIEAAERLTSILGPYIVQSDGAVFHPHAFTRQKYLRGLNAQIPYPLNLPMIHWHDCLMERKGRRYLKPPFPDCPKSEPEQHRQQLDTDQSKADQILSPGATPDTISTFNLQTGSASTSHQTSCTFPLDHGSCAKPNASPAPLDQHVMKLPNGSSSPITEASQKQNLLAHDVQSQARPGSSVTIPLVVSPNSSILITGLAPTTAMSFLPAALATARLRTQGSLPESDQEFSSATYSQDVQETTHDLKRASSKRKRESGEHGNRASSTRKVMDEKDL